MITNPSLQAPIPRLWRWLTLSRQQRLTPPARRIHLLTIFNLFIFSISIGYALIYAWLYGGLNEAAVVHIVFNGLVYGLLRTNHVQVGKWLYISLASSLNLVIAVIVGLQHLPLVLISFMLTSLFITSRQLVVYALGIGLCMALVIGLIHPPVDIHSGDLALIVVLGLAIVTMMALVWQRDYSELEEKSHLLHLATAQQEALLGNIPGTVTLLDPDLKVVAIYCNDPQIRAHYVETSPLGRKFYEVIPLAERERVQEHLQQVLSTGKKIHYESQFEDKLGQTHWLDHRATPIQNAAAETKGLVLISFDMTAQHQAEAALQELHQRYEELVNNIPNVVYRVCMNPEGRVWFEYISPQVREVNGVEPEAVLGDSSILHLLMPPEYRAVHDQKMQESAQTLQPFYLETPAQLKNGMGWLRLESYPKRLPTGIIRWDGVQTDITAQKEAERRQLQLLLEQEQIRLMTRFVQDAAHEFRTPLAIINTSLELLLRSPDHPAKYRERIHDQIDNIVTLLDALTMMVRLDSNLKITSYSINLDQLLQGLVTNVQEELSQRELQLHVNLNAAFVWGDPRHLSIALGGILKNALQNTPPGGSITLSMRQVEREICLEITDTGIGMAPEVEVRIFERFFRGDPARTERGFGLGLPIAQKIIELHKGRIAVTSTLGEGTSVQVWLPLYQAPQKVENHVS